MCIRQLHICWVRGKGSVSEYKYFGEQKLTNCLLTISCDGNKLKENYPLEDFIKYPVNSVIGLLYAVLCCTVSGTLEDKSRLFCFFCSVVTTRGKLLHPRLKRSLFCFRVVEFRCQCSIFHSFVFFTLFINKT